MYTSSVQQLNEDSIEFSLSTHTRSSSKASQSKFLHCGQYDRTIIKRETSGLEHYILHPYLSQLMLPILKK